MADPSQRNPSNAPGPLFVGTGCSDCGQCSYLAPSLFARSDKRGWSFVFRQPETEEELAAAREAIRICPVEAIGMVAGCDSAQNNMTAKERLHSREDQEFALLTWRILHDLETLPVGLEVSAKPKKIIPQFDGDWWYWFVELKVTAMERPLRIVEFGLLTRTNEGAWTLSCQFDRPWGRSQFSSWFTGGSSVLEPGVPVVASNLLNRRGTAKGCFARWYFIAEDASGTRFRGEVEVRECEASESQVNQPSGFVSRFLWLLRGR